MAERKISPQEKLEKAERETQNTSIEANQPPRGEYYRIRKGPYSPELERGRRGKAPSRIGKENEEVPDLRMGPSGHYSFAYKPRGGSKSTKKSKSKKQKKLRKNKKSMKKY